MDSFQKLVWSYYQKNKRPLPWRENITPYRIFVSEVMLQQTQVSRIVSKFPQFVKTFPDFELLAASDTKSLLTAWKGLGYHRRALYLRKAAQIVVQKYNGSLPQSVEELDALPGIGPATAASIAVYAFDKPHSFIETNIRTIFLHHFFSGKKNVTDAQLLPLIEKYTDPKNPREWYYALMDYGTYLKKVVGSLNMKSAHYVKQSKFDGSTRQLRSKILHFITEKPRTLRSVEHYCCDDRAMRALQQLQDEGFIIKRGGKFNLL